MPFSVLFAICGFIGHTIGFTCDETVSHCFTSINISSTYTMQDKNGVRVYAKDRQLYSHEGPVPTGDIISADGWNLTRMLITANGTMPGPPIFMYQNQTITVLVHNNLVNESVTIHWHGIDQLEHPAMDGVAYVTQCPILPGQFFNYTFKPRFGGTYWYHSHLGIQRDMGLYGAFIVIRKRDYFRKPSMNQHIIQIQEWNHQYDANELLNINPLPEPHSILINGRGQFKGILAPIETFNVTKGERYLFRLIGVGSHSTLLFSIPGLKLKVFETDGFEVVPTVVDKIIIFPAERYDFELELNNVKDKMYNITVSVLSSPNLTIGNDIGLGFLNVANGNSTSSVIISNGNGLIVLNCPFQTYPNKKDFTCILVSDLESTTHLNNDAFSDEHIPKTNEKLLRFLNFGFPEGNSSVNGRIYHSPTVAPLTQPSETDTNCGNCGDEKTCKCSYSISLSSGSEVIMVLMTLGEGATISHPVHMHGHTFEVLKMVIPKVTNNDQFVFTEDIKCSETFNNSQSQCNNAKWRNESWNDYKNIPGIKLTNPVRKDTIVVPYGGYVIIRIDARNPGVWFLHCHIDKHMIEGMAVMLNESFEHQHKYVPEGLPKCNSRLESNSGVVNNATGSIHVPCSVPRDLQNSEWQYKGEDNYIQYTSSLRFHTTKLLHFSIPPSFPDEELYLPNWTCINTFNISNEETIVVFKKDKVYSGSWFRTEVWLYLCMKFRKESDNVYQLLLLSDVNEKLRPQGRVYSSKVDNVQDEDICEGSGEPNPITLHRVKYIDIETETTTQEQNQDDIPISTQVSIIPHGEIVLGQSLVLECKVRLFSNVASWSYNGVQLTQCFSFGICTIVVSGNYKFTSNVNGIYVTIDSLSYDELGITWTCSINQHSANYTVQEQNASCSLPQDLRNKVWEYSYTQVSDSSKKVINLDIKTTTLQNSAINLNFQGSTLDDWTCINSLHISNTTTVVVFKSDQTFSKGLYDGNYRLYLCMKLTRITADLYYFYLLSDVHTGIIPKERAFESKGSDPMSSSVCQYTDSPPKIRTLRKQGTNDVLPNDASLCEPWDSACDVDDMCDPNPCQNNGTCVDLTDSFNCTCAPGWEDDNCTTVMTCDYPSIVHHTTNVSSGNELDDTITFSCTVGYEHISGDSVRTCRCDGNWEGSPIHCEPVTCPNPPVVSFATKSSQTGSTYLDKITYTCDKGYERTGGYLVRTCKEDKKWDGSPPVCTIVTCPNPPDVAFATVSSQTGSNYNDSITYTCNIGYESTHGTLDRKCNENKLWDGTPPVCTIVTCPNPPDVAFATVSSQTGSNYNDSITYTCNIGYESTDGTLDRKCNENKLWDGTPPVCKSMYRCLENTDRFDIKWNITAGNTLVTVSCTGEYTGTVSRNCSSSGMWDEPDYTQCIRKSIKNLIQQMDKLLAGDSEFPLVSTTLGNLANITKSNNELRTGDIVTASALLGDIAKYVTNDTDKISVDQLENFGSICNELLDENYHQSWKELKDKGTSGVTALVKAVTEYTSAFHNVLDGTSSITVIKENIVITVGKSSSPEITVPDRQTNDSWITDSGTEMKLKQSMCSDLTGYSCTFFRNISGLFPKYLLLNRKVLPFEGIYDVNSIIADVSIESGSCSDYSLELRFGHLLGNHSRPVCGFWDFNASNTVNGAWSSFGSLVAESGDSYTLCKYNHTTNFAILMSPEKTPSPHNLPLSMISAIGCGVSILFLVVTIVIHTVLWRYVRNDRTKALMNLCVALVLSYIIFLAGITRTENKDACTAIAVALHYMFLTDFAMMLAEGILIVRMVIIVFPTKSIVNWLLPACWAVPGIIVGISAGLTKLSGYGNRNFCWLTLESNLIWAFIGPALIVILINFVIIIITVYKMMTTKGLAKKTLEEKSRIGLKSICVILPLFGVTWVLGAFSVNEDLVMFQYLFAIFNSLQGLFICLFHCFLNKQIRQGYNHYQRRRKSNRSNSMMSTDTSNYDTHKRQQRNSNIISEQRKD